MGNCISEYDFELYVDPYDAGRAGIGDRKGTIFAIVDRLAAEHGDGLDVARLLCAAPAMLRALEVALQAYSPNSHLLGVECSAQQKYAASSIRAAIGLALYGQTPGANEVVGGMHLGNLNVEERNTRGMQEISCIQGQFAAG